MIVTIVNHATCGDKRLLAENLAVMRARQGRAVLLLDADAQLGCQQWGQQRERSGLRPAVSVRALRGHTFTEALERFEARFDDLVIDTSAADTHEMRCALIAARVAVVPLAADQADCGRQYPLIAGLNAARMFNPGLRVLFVIAGDEHDPASAERAAVRAYAAQVMSAGVAATVLHRPALSWGASSPGHCACDVESSAGAAEMTGLYQEVYQDRASIALSRRPLCSAWAV
jgi:chromosome partitioning protein